MHRIQPLRDAEYRKNADPLVRLCKPRSIPMRARVVPCLLQLATADLTPRRYDTDSRRNDAPAARSLRSAFKEAARLSSEEDNPAA